MNPSSLVKGLPIILIPGLLCAVAGWLVQPLAARAPNAWLLLAALVITIVVAILVAAAAFGGLARTLDQPVTMWWVAIWAPLGVLGGILLLQRPFVEDPTFHRVVMTMATITYVVTLPLAFPFSNWFVPRDADDERRFPLGAH